MEMEMDVQDAQVSSSHSPLFAFPDFSYCLDQDLVQLARQVRDEPDDIDTWGKLIEAAQSQEGGLNRNSNPQAIAATRETFDYLLARFPLFFGFWKKYADLEFTIGGPEAAEMIYERGIASIGTSVDLWTNYCAFKVETSHDPDINRVLFERAVESAGLDFLAHPLWDKYLEYEERLESPDRIFAILARVIHIPLHQYARYFEKYTTLAQSRQTEELAPEDVIEEYRKAVSIEFAQRPAKPADIDNAIRLRCNEYHREIFNRTQAETTKRWVYEQEIRRPYFHVSELDEPQLENWRKYLDFEEAEGNHSRIRFLYERCLVTTALYDDFWLRYARWFLGQTNVEKVVRVEEVRYIYVRACAIYVPIHRPAVRLIYAKFEESLGNPESAVNILEDVLRTLPGNIEAITAISNVYRRSSGVDTAIEKLQKHVSESSDGQLRAALVVEHTRLLWRIKGDAAGARKVFEQHFPSALASREFWLGWFEFEAAQPTSEQNESVNFQRIKHVYDLIRTRAQLSSEVNQELSSYYFQYLEERGGKDAMTEFIELDLQVSGPVSVANGSSAKATSGNKDGAAQKRAPAGNGYPA